MGKKSKYTHEMFKDTSVHAGWRRITQGGLERYRRLMHEPDDAVFRSKIRKSFDEVWNDKRADAVELYKRMDACFAAAKMEVPHRANDIVSDIRTLIARQYDCPGFVTPKGERLWDEFQNFLEGHTWLVKSLVEWSQAGQFVYTIAPTLSEMLVHTKLGALPCQNLQMPAEHIYVCPPRGTWEAMHLADSRMEDIWDTKKDSDTEGVLISQLHVESEQEGYPVVGLMCMRTTTTRTGPTIVANTMFKVHLEPRATLNDAIHATLTDKDRGPYNADNDVTLQKIIEYTAAVLVYATSQDADVILARNSPEYKKWTKELSRYPGGHKKRKPLLEQLARADGSGVHYLGRSLVIERHTEKEAAVKGEGTHASPRAHWRQGHFRSQPYGPRDKVQYKTIWIRPTVIGMGNPGVTRQRHLK